MSTPTGSQSSDTAEASSTQAPVEDAPAVAPRILGIQPSRRVFYGWYVVAAGALNQFIAGALLNNAFGAYNAALVNEFGWSRGAISLGFSIARLESGILGPLQGWMIDRFGPRAIMRLGMVLFGIGFLLFSQLNSLLTFYVFFAIMSLGASLGGFMSITVAVVNWFDRARSRALGISQVGFAFGGLTSAGIILAIAEIGWREVAFVSGIIVLVVGLPLASFIINKPEDIGMHVDGLTPAQAQARREEDARLNRRSQSTGMEFTARQAMRTVAFWTISLGHTSALFVVSAVMVHLYLHLTGSLGYSAGVAAFFIALMTAFQIIGQVAGASLGDYFSKRLICITCMGMHAVGLLLVTHVHTVVAVVAFCVLHGLAWGTRGPLMQAWRADYFGRGSFGSIMGFSSVIIMIGTIAAPWFAGWMYDRTGSYEVGFTVIAAIAALGSVFFLLSRRPKPPTASQA